MSNNQQPTAVTTAIEPWLSVKNSKTALKFYKKAFGAKDVYRLEETEIIVAKLVVDGAAFWIGETTDKPVVSNIRMILVTANPEALFQQAVQAGAKVIFPVGEEHGWKLGRVEDPFGHHWEIGHQV